jgi:hypothetical protein
MKKRLIKETHNFNTHLNTSTVMVGDNYHSGEITLDDVTYYFAKYKNKVRVWDRKATYMALLNDEQDFIMEIDLAANKN